MSSCLAKPCPTSAMRAGKASALAALFGVLVMFAALFAGPAGPLSAARAHAEDSATGFDSWSQIAEGIDGQLKDGKASYDAGDSAAAASDFENAYHMLFHASNYAKVVSDTLGQDVYNRQDQQFQQIVGLEYTPGQGAQLDQIIATLTSDVKGSAATLDQNPELKNPRDYAAARDAETKQEREELQANKKRVNKGKGDRTWGDVAVEMNAILDKAYDKAASGDAKDGRDLVNNAYYQYYEKLGFEKNVMNAISGSRVTKVEYQFKATRKAMNEGASAGDVKALVDDLKNMLVTDAAKLDGGAEQQVSGFSKFITSSIGQAFIILIREGLEALLVVAAVIAYLIKSGNKRFVKWIYLGVLLGLAGSGIIAVVLGRLFGGSGPQQEIMEGVCALVAMVMLLWTSNWMLNKSSVESWNRYIASKTETAVSSARARLDAGGHLSLGMVASLAALSFLAVFREGAETVIFYESIYSMSQDARGMWIGGLAAAAVLVVVFLIIRFTSVKIPIGPFFLVTSILMAVLVVIFAGGGVHALIEGDVFDVHMIAGLPTNDWLGFYPYVETIVAQVLAAAAVIILFAVGFIRQRNAKAELVSGDGGAPNTPAEQR